MSEPKTPPVPFFCAHLEGGGSESAEGLCAELGLVARCMARLGHPASAQDLWGVSGTILRAHFFRPSDNPGMPTRPDPARPADPWAPRYAWSSLRHNNYGHLESISYFYGVQLRPVSLPKVLDLWRVLRFELDEGRPVLAWGLVEDGHPELVVGYRLEKNPLRQLLLVHSRLHPGEPVEVEITGRDILQGPKARYPNELLLVRPGDLAPYRGPDEDRYADMLRWAWGHMKAGRELVYETGRFYAVGLSAWEAFEDFLRHRVVEELEDPLVCPEVAARDLGRFAQAVASQWRTCRAAAPAFFERLAQECADRPLADLHGGAPELRALGQSCARTAQTLGEVEALLRGDPALVISEPTLRALAAETLARAANHERRTADLLRALAQR